MIATSTLRKLPEAKRKLELNNSYCEFKLLKYNSRQDGAVCYNKKMMYKYSKHLKSTILKNKRRNKEIIIDIVVFKGKTVMWKDAWNKDAETMKISI
jgi:hypothetical protein